jgi:hypothetical protein
MTNHNQPNRPVVAALVVASAATVALVLVGWAISHYLVP